MVGTEPSGPRWLPLIREGRIVGGLPVLACARHGLRFATAILVGEVYVLTTDSPGPTGNTGRVFRLGSAVAL